jgi:hypothetical protein
LCFFWRSTDGCCSSPFQSLACRGPRVSSTWIWTSPEGQQTEFTGPVSSTIAPDEALVDKVTELNGYAVTIARGSTGLATTLTDSFGRTAALHRRLFRQSQRQRGSVQPRDAGQSRNERLQH